MIDAPQITKAPERLAAVIHLTIPRSEMRSVIGPSLTEVMASVAVPLVARVARMQV